MRHHISELYFALLPVPLMASTIFGTATGFNYGLDNKNPIDSFSGMIGYTSLGMITGIIYPVSFPLLAGYTLFRPTKPE